MCRGSRSLKHIVSSLQTHITTKYEMHICCSKPELSRRSKEKLTFDRKKWYIYDAMASRMRFNLFTAGIHEIRNCHQQSLNEFLIFHLFHQGSKTAVEEGREKDFNFIFFLKFNQNIFNKYFALCFLLNINYKFVHRLMRSFARLHN